MNEDSTLKDYHERDNMESDIQSFPISATRAALQPSQTTCNCTKSDALTLPGFGVLCSLPSAF